MQLGAPAVSQQAPFHRQRMRIIINSEISVKLMVIIIRASSILHFLFCDVSLCCVQWPTAQRYYCFGPNQRIGGFVMLCRWRLRARIWSIVHNGATTRPRMPWSRFLQIAIGIVGQHHFFGINMILRKNV